MASTAASTYTTNAPNYQGVLLQIAPKKTPLMTLLLNAGKTEMDGNKVINMSKYWTPDGASQPSITEADSLSAPSESSFINSQATNVCQIFHEACEASYDKQVDSIVSGTVGWDQGRPENDGLDSQIAKHLRMIKLDQEYSILNGTYQADGGSSATARKMRGIITAISTNTVAAGTNALSKDMIEELMISMGENEAEMSNMLLMARPYQISALNALYANSMRSSSIGGVTLTTILTSQGELNLVQNMKVASGALVIVDFDYLSLNFTPLKGQNYLVEELAKLGLGDRAQAASTMGINYTHESLHGKITGLATS